MSDSGQLLILIGRFLEDSLSFAELTEWIQDREEYWASLPSDAVVKVLADTVMLACYEVDAGHRDVESVKDLVSEASLQPVSHA